MSYHAIAFSLCVVLMSLTLTDARLSSENPTVGTNCLIEWNAPVRPNGQAVKGLKEYRVYTSQVSGVYDFAAPTKVSAEKAHTSCLEIKVQSDGHYYLIVTAVDSLEQESLASKEASFIRDVAAVDTTPPLVAISAPKTGDVVERRSQMTIKVTAGDDSGVLAEVKVFVNNDPISHCQRLVTPPFECIWEVPAPPGRTYALQASARDRAGNVKLSTIVRVKSSMPQDAQALRSAPKRTIAPSRARTPWGTPEW